MPYEGHLLPFASACGWSFVRPQSMYDLYNQAVNWRAKRAYAERSEALEYRGRTVTPHSASPASLPLTVIGWPCRRCGARRAFGSKVLLEMDQFAGVGPLG